MSKLFSYVVQHDFGYAPNPAGGFCTLAKCKCGRRGRKNIIELAEVGDWVAGTSGADLRVSAGHGKLIYAMRVEEKPTLREYHQDARFRGRRDNEARDAHLHERYALISSFFYYFGRNAPDLSGLPAGNLRHPFEKRGPGHRSDFTEEFIRDFAGWLESSWEIGQHGAPCGDGLESSLQVHRKRRCSG
ncbi:MAG: hypothetical protein ABIE42_08430 [Candidatus Eisenbacteria bacterium]